MLDLLLHRRVIGECAVLVTVGAVGMALRAVRLRAAVGRLRHRHAARLADVRHTDIDVDIRAAVRIVAVFLKVHAVRPRQRHGPDLSPRPHGGFPDIAVKMELRVFPCRDRDRSKALRTGFALVRDKGVITPVVPAVARIQPIAGDVRVFLHPLPIGIGCHKPLPQPADLVRAGRVGVPGADFQPDHLFFGQGDHLILQHNVHPFGFDASIVASDTGHRPSAF